MKRTLGLAGLALVAAACGGSGLRIHARTAHVTGKVIEQAGTVLRTKRLEQQKNALIGVQYREDAQRRITLVRAEWEPILGAYEKLRVAYNLWIDWLIVYVERDQATDSKLVRLIRDVVLAWNLLHQAARLHDVTVPAPPSVLVELSRRPDA